MQIISQNAVCHAMKEPIVDNPEGLKVFVWVSQHAIVGAMAERGMNDATTVIAKMGMHF